MLVGPVLLGLAILIATGLLIAHLHRQALAHARQEQQGQAIVLSSQAERSIEAIEMLQTVLQERYQTAAMTTPENFRGRLTSEDVGDDLRSRARLLPQLDALVIIDANGFVINYSRAEPLPKVPVNVADRDFFEALAKHPERATFVSDLTLTRTTGIWTVYIARRIQSAEGDFLGIIMGSLNLEFLESTYASVTLHPDTAIALLRTDGRLLARHPSVARALGATGSSSLMAVIASGGLAQTIILKSPADKRERLLAIQHLANYPLILIVSNTTSAILEGWRYESACLAAIALALELLVAGGAVQMLRHLRNQQLLHEARGAQAEAEASLVVAEERAEAARKLQTQNMRFSAALGNMSQGLVMLDAQDRVVVANERLRKMFALQATDVGTSMADLYQQAIAAGTLTIDDLQVLTLDHEGLKSRREHANYMRQLADGRALNVNFAPIDDGGWMVTLEDVTTQRQAQARIAHMAHHDMLTGLPNRALFHSRLSEAVARGRRGNATALLYLDLDHFKAVNDTLGHPTGDALLQAVTQRLNAHLRETDTIARLGGDEFAILQSHIDAVEEVQMLALRLIDVISAPYDIDGQNVIIGTSIGIAIIPADGDNPDLALRNADLALYRAKAQGRGSYCFFKAEMEAVMRERRTLELNLHAALAAEQFRLFYQPLINIETDTVSGFEALIRWFHPERGLVPPSEFVPFAEETGLIVPIGRWVLRQACLEAARWPGSVCVSVNVSAVQFSSHTLVDDVEAALRDSGLHPSRLQLEITETVMLQDADSVLRCMNQLCALGVVLAVDDFGTGYSSLSYLRSFPFSKVKIDRSLVEGLGQGRDVDAVFAAVVDLCHTLGMTVVAEGVETEDQVRVLRAARCAEAQGYLFSTPAPPEQVADICQRLGRSRWGRLLLPETI